MAKAPRQTGMSVAERANLANSGGKAPPVQPDQQYFDIGISGLRQFSGWVREEFLPQLQGRQAARVYREMMDNSSTVGAVVFAITGVMRKVEWRVIPADDTPEAQEMADFADSLRYDMSHTWEDFVVEALSMLGYGFAPFEIVYKRRLGQTPGGTNPDGEPLPKSQYDDGRIGLRRLPIRGQDTIIKWFFGPNGGIRGMTQQPYVGPIIDIPIEKLLLFRPSHHKGNPEGRSILRSAYRSYYFLKRLEEQEAILFERMSGLPVMRVPNALLEAANAGDALATSALTAYKKLVSNVRIDEQMGLLIPSDTYPNPQGGAGSTPMYEFKLETPNSGKSNLDANTPILRYKSAIMTSVLADFLEMGHSSRGSQNLGETKMDLFLQSIEGWLKSIASVLNRHLLPRVWELNGFDPALMPEYQPDMAQRIDLDNISNFVLRLAQAGMTMFPDEDLESYLRDAAGLPDLPEGAEFGDQDDEDAAHDTGATATAKRRIMKSARRR